MSVKTCRVILLEISDMDIDAMRAVLHQELGADMVGRQLETIDSLAQAFQQEQWDLILHDTDLSHISVSQVMSLLEVHQLKIPVICMAGPCEIDDVVNLMRMGVRGVVKGQDHKRLGELIREELRYFILQTSQDFPISSAVSGESYRAIVNNQSEYICRYDPQMRLTFVNKAYCEWQAAQPSELLGTSIINKIPLEDQGQAIAHVASLTVDSPLAVSIHKSILPDGQYRWIEWTDRAIFNDAGQIVEYQGVGRDVTDRRRAENELRFHSAVLQNMAEGVHIVRVDNETFVYANPTLEKMFGYQSGELLGKHVSVLNAPSSRDPQTVALEIMDSLAQYGLWRGEVHNIRKDRSTFWCRANVVAFDHDEFGPVWITVQEDITEQKRAQTSLEELNERLEDRVSERTEELITAKNRIEAIFNSSGDGILLVDYSLRMRQANKACDQLFELPLDKHLGRKLTTLVHMDDSPRIFEISRLAVANQKTHQAEVRIRKRSGTYCFIEMSMSPITESALPAPQLVCTIRDITERKEAERVLVSALEKEKELGELKSRFVTMASHEFRTPLAAIMATAETLRRYRGRMDDGQINMRLDKILDQVDHMKDIMEDVLQLARIQAGWFAFKPDYEDLHEMCEQVVDEFDSQRIYHGRILFVSDNSPVEFYFDLRLMRQLLSNLIHNALKYSAADQNVILELVQDLDSIHIRIIDEGIGIPQKDLTHLFEPFHRAENVGTIPGTGLGLSITKRAVVAHGGSIDVYSRVDKGTTFTIVFPKQGKRNFND